MASKSAWPTVQPLPRFIVQLGIAVSFVVGHVLLWKDRRALKAAAKMEKPLGVPAYK